MDSPEQPDLLATPATDSPRQGTAAAAAGGELFALRRLFQATLVALLAPALAGTLFFAKQMRMVRGELAEFRPMLSRVRAEYRQKEPKMKAFVAAVQAYAVTHPDFQPVLQRYRAALPEYFVAPVSLSSSPLRFPPTNAPGPPGFPAAPRK